MFVDFVGAFMATSWLAKNVRQMALKVALGLALMLVLIPNLQLGVFFTPVTFPRSSARRCISSTSSQPTRAMLPIGFIRTDLLWQQAADYNFSLSSGYGGFSRR